VSTGLYYSVVCGELFNPPDEGAFDAANAGVPDQIRTIFAPSWYGLLNYCPTWPVGDPRPELSQPVTSGVRTLVNSGAIDPITPPPFGDLAATTLSDRVVVVYANSGHGATLQSSCGQEILFGFLADPAATPDTSCAAQVTTQYVLPTQLARRPPPVERVRLEMRMSPPPPAVRERPESAFRRAR
jgi:TAP-like protein